MSIIFLEEITKICDNIKNGVYLTENQENILKNLEKVEKYVNENKTIDLDTCMWKIDAKVRYGNYGYRRYDVNVKLIDSDYDDRDDSDYDTYEAFEKRYKNGYYDNIINNDNDNDNDDNNDNCQNNKYYPGYRSGKIPYSSYDEEAGDQTLVVKGSSKKCSFFVSRFLGFFEDDKNDSRRD